jgi:hypothetical protein
VPKLNQIKNVRTTHLQTFPSTNQALHCWNRYNRWLVCAQQAGEEAKPLRQYAESVCPGSFGMRCGTSSAMKVTLVVSEVDSTKGTLKDYDLPARLVMSYSNKVA